MLDIIAKTVFNGIEWMGTGNNSMLVVIVVLMVIAVVNFKVNY